MASIAIRLFVVCSVWFCSITQAEAQYAGKVREISENVTYHFGQHTFVESPVIDETSPEATPPFGMDRESARAPASDQETTGMTVPDTDHDFFSNDAE